ncbi:MAG: hypothetical protein IJY26_01800 [Clostridia bacterium]|nr:hypothetical protein [Clostridia bacterium]
MGNKSVAILDVRSMSVTAVIGEAGVNNTFIFKGSQSQSYEGYENGRFYSVKDLKDAVYTALNAAEGSANEHLKTVYVGVPGEFIKIVNKKHMIGFATPKRISAGDKEMLFKDGYGTIEESAYENIHTSALYFITSDSRKVRDPSGIVSSTLQANVCYMLSSTYFNSTLRDMLREYGFKNVYFVPTSYAQATYLLSEEKRRESAVMLDIGTLSSTVSIVYGDGIFQEKTFWVGEGHIVAELCQKWEISYADALEVLKQANLFRLGGVDIQITEDKRVTVDKVNEIIKFGLDKLCEPLAAFLEECSAISANRTLLITGEGITGIRGAVEHISKRLNRETDVLAPELPYYNKPSMSSKISLLHYALKNRKKEGFFNKLLNGFGG